MTVHQFWLSDPLGNRLEPIDPISAEGVRILNTYGNMTLVFDSSYDNYIAQDRLIEWWRDGKLWQIMFMRGWKFYTDNDGRELTRVWGPDQNELLRRRVVAFYAGWSESSKTDYADDMMKVVVDENLLAGAGIRLLDTTHFKIEPEFRLAPSITKSFAWKNVLDVLKDINAASATAGTKLYFDIVANALADQSLVFEFRTYINQRGIDHSSTTTEQVFFGPAYENIKNASYTEDWTEDANYIYAGGDGEGDARQIITASDSTRYLASPWALREKFVDGRGLDTAALTSKANEELEKGKPLKTFDGILLSTDDTTFGVHWNLGDRVTAEYRGRQFDGIVKAVSIDYANKQETITGVFEVD